jgi:hypothetical protein
MLLVNGSGLVEENSVEVFHLYGVQLSTSSFIEISSPYEENNTVVVFLFPFHISIPLPDFWFIRLQG